MPRRSGGEEVALMLLAEELPLSQAESRLLEVAREFSRHEVGPNAARWERERAYPRETIRAAAGLGLTRIQIPAALGGLDLRFRAKVRVVEEIARDDFAFAFALVNTHNSAARLARDGNDSQRARYLDGLLRGELIGAVSLTEPSAGSDFPAIRTRAERVAGGWLLNGEKAWLTNGAAVDVVVVYAQTDPAAGGKGIAAFVVDAQRKGFERGAAYGLAGAHAIGAAGLMLDNYFAADDDLFYAPGAAFKNALASITGARIYVAAMCCGMVEEALVLALARARARSTFGRPLIERQGLRWMLADVATDFEAARLLTYRATRLLEAGQDAVLAAAHAKKFATRMAERRLPQCMQVFGAEGLMEAHPIGRHLAAARVAHYADGTTEIQNERIAAYLERGIPGEPTRVPQ
jgi:alkylation response protein AidB-like acyl-CoA dehydrogenase